MLISPARNGVFGMGAAGTCKPVRSGKARMSAAVAGADSGEKHERWATLKRWMV